MLLDNLPRLLVELTLFEIMKKHLCLLSIVFCCSTSLISQQIDSLFIEVKRMQELRLQNIFSEKRDSIFNLFDISVQRLMISTEFCNFQLDSTTFQSNPSKSDEGMHLAYTFINNLVKCSSDHKIRVFSWDNLEGGSYHTYTNYLQYKTINGNCKTIPFETIQNNVEVGYYRIEKVSKENRIIYIIFGYGTYGGGRQHKNVRFFELINDEPKECFKFYSNGIDLVVYSNRNQNPDIKLDKEKGIITYREFLYNEETGFYGQEFIQKTVVIFDEE